MIICDKINYWSKLRKACESQMRIFDYTVLSMLIAVGTAARSSCKISESGEKKNDGAQAKIGCFDVLALCLFRSD